MLILAEEGRRSGRKRRVALTLAVVLVVICLSSLVLGAAVVWQSPVFIPIQVGNSEIVVEVDRSPDCANGMLGICDIGGTGLTWLSVWRYTRPTPTSRMAQRLFAVPVAP